MTGVAPQTVGYAGWVYGTEPRDDRAEELHEASRLDPDVVDPAVVGGTLLARSPDLQASATRSVRRRIGLPAVELPPPAPLEMPLGQAVARRRSVRTYGAGQLSLPELTALLHATYGVTGSYGAQDLRSAPSGGALYPLEVYVAATSVRGLRRALYHYDPLGDVLERTRSFRRAELAGLTPYDDLLVPAAAVAVVSGVFWRSRFKYGARGYRFTLVEAGHAAHGYLLAATSLGLAACPVGGFFDRRVDAFLGVDGLYEASLYLLPAGRPA